MPQLDTAFYVTQVFWLIISFSFLYLFVKYWFLPKIRDGLAVRESKITNLINEAEELKVQIQNLKESYTGELSVLHKDLSNISLETERFCKKYYESNLETLQKQFSVEKQEISNNIDQWKASLDGNIKAITLDLSKALLNKLVENQLDVDETNIDLSKYYNKN
jgi:F-type H+-transporting ATPase subunit b